MREVRHVVQEIAPRVHEVELALQLRDPRLHHVAFVALRRAELPLRGGDFSLETRHTRVEIALLSLQSLRRTRSVAGVLLQLCLAAEELRIRARELEREGDDAVCRLPVGIENE